MESKTTTKKAENDNDAYMLDALCDFPDRDQLTILRHIVASQDVALAIRDRGFNPLYANPAFFKLFDTTHDIWKQNNWSAHFSPAATTIVYNESIPQTLSGKEWRGEFEIVTQQGEKKHVAAEWASISDKEGAILCCYEIYHEITSVKYFQTQLQKQNRFFNEIIDTIPDPLSVVDKDHALIAVNESFCRLIGRTREELTGNNEYDYFPKDEADVFWEQDDIALATDKDVATEEYVTNKNGQRRLLSRKRIAITQADGQKILIRSGRDITNERLLAKNFADAYNQLESDLTALKRDLVAIKNGVDSGVSRVEAIRELFEQCNIGFADFINEKEKEPASKNKELSVPQHLSPREYQVFMFLLRGLRIKDIAGRLNITPNTASTYRSRVMKKLGFTSLTEMIQYAIQFGLI